MKALKTVAFLSLLSIANSSFSAEGWSGDFYKVSMIMIDAVQAENFAYITLEGYQNSNCSDHRMALWHSSKEKFDQTF